MENGNLIQNLNFSWLFDGSTLAILFLSVLLLSICCLASSLYFRKQNKNLYRSLIQIQNELRAMNSGHLGMGREIRKVSREVAEYDNVHSLNPANEKDQKTYEQAGLLLSRGATIEEVVDSFDIAPAEAELLITMHQLSLKDDYQEDNYQEDGQYFNKVS